MEDVLSTLWDNLSLIENEATTININPKKLSSPTNALIGRLAMRKFVSIFDIEKGLRNIWDMTTSMEINQLGDNLFMFEFKDSKACKRIYNKQLWNFRGSLFLLDRIHGDECPSDFNRLSVPFWIQGHNLQI